MIRTFDLVGISLLALQSASAFQPAPRSNHGASYTLSTDVPMLPTSTSSAKTLLLKGAASEDGYDADAEEDDDEEDDDDYIDDSSLGDWRAFRATLASSGLSSSDDADESTTASTGSSEEGIKSQKARKSVSKSNEALLKTQNEELFREYESGVWAHEAPDAEIGGLLCRLPLEAEIYRNKEYNAVGKRLHDLLDGEGGSADDNKPAMSDDGDATGLGSSPGVSFSLTGAKTLYWYRKAKKLIEEETQKVTASAVGGEIDAAKLPKASIDFLNLYLSHQDTWQEVCLVTEKNSNGMASTLVLNRPMAFTISDSIARLVLFGAYRNDLEPEEMELLVKFSIAFDKEIFVYLGGPDELEQNAQIVHGIPDLKGSKEIAPNTGIFIGGVETIEAAVHSIMQGMSAPIDYRLFVGKHRYLEGRLDLECVLGKYQPVACSRALALKQCKALPKPLFHEVMELCGGELAELSKLELMKRDDIQLEARDEE